MATETHESVAGACVDAAGSAIGMPQLCAEWIPNQVFWLLVTLVVIYLILSRMALPRIGAILAERAGTITNDVAAAEEMKQRAIAAEAAYEKALADARAEANRIIAETKVGIQSDLDLELQKADAQIAAKVAESEQALGEIRAESVVHITTVARDTAAALVAALGVTTDAETIQAAVSSRIRG